MLPVTLLQTSQSFSYDSKHQQAPRTDWYCPSITARVQHGKKVFQYSTCNKRQKSVYFSRVCLTTHIMLQYYEQNDFHLQFIFFSMNFLFCFIKQNKMLSGINKLRPDGNQPNSTILECGRVIIFGLIYCL